MRSAALLLAAQLLCLPLAAEAQAAPQLSVIHDFNGDHGGGPWAGLALGADGVLFGTTRIGGSPDNHGTIFKLMPAATPSGYQHEVLHRFSGTDGQFPQSGVVLGADGSLLGTTISGGSFGGGTVYRMVRPNNPTRKHRVLRNFHFNIGETLVGNVVQDENGNLYGAASQSGRHLGGTLYKLTQPAEATQVRASWPLAILRHFRATQIADSRSTLIRDDAGNLYGTATGGLGGGLVYRLAPSGQLSVLYVFPAGEGSPHAGLLRDGDGILYGTAIGGGSGSFGVVFSLTPPPEGSKRWKFRELHGFDGNDGSTPSGPLIMDQDGTLFGTTATGGTFSGGTVFALKRPLPGKNRWRHRTLAHLDIATGRAPLGGLVRDQAGVLYGTTSNGGAFNQGTAFKIVP